MNISTKHPAASLLHLIREQNLSEPGHVTKDFWSAYWFPLDNGKTQVRMLAPVRLEHAQAVEVIIELAKAGTHCLIGEDCEGCRTELNFRLSPPLRIRIEEDEEGAPRAITASQIPSRFFDRYSPFGGDVA